MKSSATGSSVDDGKACAALAYFLIGIIWFFVDEKMRKNSFAAFHTKQAIVLMITSLIGHTVLTIIPIIGWLLLPFFSLLILIFAIIQLLAAFQGQEKELPVVGKFAEKLSF